MQTSMFHGWIRSFEPLRSIRRFEAVPRLPRRSTAAGHVLAVALLVPSMLGGLANAAVLPAGFAETAVVTSGIPSPTAMEFAPDGRLFVCQQNGQLRVVKNGVLLTTPFLTVTVNASGERGLLGVTFDPAFAENRFVYVYYTATSPAVHNRVSRFTADGDVATPGSEVVLLDLDDLSGAANHNGGAIHFGTDGKLYVAVGENARTSNSQTLGNRLGKMLRIDKDGTIPTDNPFYATATGPNRSIWSLGLRNPFTFAVHPVSGRIFVNDVGEDAWEEINEGIAGANYGWPNCEGSCIPSDPNHRDPVFQYPHGSGTSAGYSIAGGTFYVPSTPQFPGTYTGRYFFADYVNGWIRSLDPGNGNQVSPFATGILGPVDLKVGPDGRLYYLARGNIQGGSGSVHAIGYTGNQLPQITQQPVDRTVQVGQPATFSVTASSGSPLTYQWRRGTSDIPGAGSASYTLATTALSDDGSGFRCVVGNSFGSVISSPATLAVTDNRPPAGSISLPAAGTLYSAGDTIRFSGTGTDPEDGTLPSSAFTWLVVFHHDTHTHPFLGPIDGVSSGSFVVPTSGETSADVWYRIHLRVTDSGGLSRIRYVDVSPRVSRLTLSTVPPGLRITLDGQPMTTPVAIDHVVGISRTLGVVSPQTVGADTYTFESWSDGGAASHAISVPLADTTYVATFRSGSGLAAPAAIGANDGVYTDYVRTVWTRVSGATHYQLSRAASPGGPKTPLSGWITGTSYADTGGVPGVVYYYSARAAVDGSGGQAGPSSVEDPGWRGIRPPGGVSASDGTFADRVVVAWNSSQGATHYRVSRSTTPAGVKSPLSGWIAANAYADVTANPGVIYHYAVQGAVDSQGQRASPFSAVDSGHRSGSAAALASLAALDAPAADDVRTSVGGPQIMLVVPDESRSLRMIVHGAVGSRLGLEASDDGVAWRIVSERDAPDGEAEFEQPTSGTPSRFFRAVPVPR